MTLDEVLSLVGLCFHEHCALLALSLGKRAVPDLPPGLAFPTPQPCAAIVAVASLEDDFSPD